MRRFLAILLLLALGLPELAPLYATATASAQTADAQLPACCRRNGAHHCAMSAAERRRLVSRVRIWSAPPEQCPFCPRTPAVTAQGPIFAPPPAFVALLADRFSSLNRSAPVEHRFAAVLREQDTRGPPPRRLS